MKLSDFDFSLPADRIAQEPAAVRDDSRLLLLRRDSGRIEHHRFRDLPELLAPQDLLVLNDSRVIPARLIGRNPKRSGQVEVLLLRRCEEEVWEALVSPGRKARAGDRIVFQAGRFEALVDSRVESPHRFLRFDCREGFWALLEELGQPPLPPYIHRQGRAEDRDRYQTVYARSSGAVAAPTAGLHFTPEVLSKCRSCALTLHVGYGTFKPIRCADVRDHRMEPERFEVSDQASSTINDQLKQGGRVVCVGSTTTRVVEHLALAHGEIRAGSGETDLFIYPGFRFQVAEALVTNFHLPKSTLFLLVAAFAGREALGECYRVAIEEGYRFYSYGDAMLIL